MDNPSSNPAGFQFDKAEFTQTSETPEEARRCEDCQKSLGGSYYTLDGRVTCFECSDAAATNAPRQDLRGLPMAVILGIGAAALGALIYLLILKLTGYEIGLIAIAVGWLVGKAMMRGSKGRGGLAYQLLAVVLTYHSIIFSYVVVGVWSMIEEAETTASAEAVPGQKSTGGATVVTPETPTPQDTANPTIPPQSAPNPAPAVSNDGTAPENEPTTIASLALIFMLIYLQALFIPFMEGLSNILGIAIILFGLWEAFRLTRLQVPVISGPFQFGEGPQTAPPTPEDRSL